MCGADTPFDFAQGRPVRGFLKLVLSSCCFGIHKTGMGFGVLKAKSKEAGEGALPTCWHLRGENGFVFVAE
jgi:hypothetical protein